MIELYTGFYPVPRRRATSLAPPSQPVPSRSIVDQQALIHKKLVVRLGNFNDFDYNGVSIPIIFEQRGKWIL